MRGCSPLARRTGTPFTPSPRVQGCRMGCGGGRAPCLPGGSPWTRSFARLGNHTGARSGAQPSPDALSRGRAAHESRSLLLNCAVQKPRHAGVPASSQENHHARIPSTARNPKITLKCRKAAQVPGRTGTHVAHPHARGANGKKSPLRRSPGHFPLSAFEEMGNV